MEKKIQICNSVLFEAISPVHVMIDKNTKSPLDSLPIEKQQKNSVTINPGEKVYISKSEIKKNENRDESYLLTVHMLYQNLTTYIRFIGEKESSVQDMADSYFKTFFNEVC